MKMASSQNFDMNNALAEQFASITGASTAIGLRMLEVCNGDLERAISMHLDGVIDVDAMDRAEGAPVAVGSTAGPSVPPDDSVRAPIPSKMDTLVEDIPSFGPRPRQRRARQSVFDGLRDFQAETRLQEEMLRNPKSAAKKRTLEDLFRPPLDLMHKGTFVTAREAGQVQGKWLMVNVQNVREFSCQQLNRDVWSDSTVKSIIRESFVFWQVYHDSDEGQRYMQFYKVTEFPYVSILDPRTGEQMAIWHKIDNEAFCDVVMQFLTDNKMEVPDIVPLSPPADSQSSSSSSSAPPAAKKARSSSIIDASEESQIEAAIAASLAEAEAAAKGSDKGGEKTKPSVIDIVSDSDDDEDDEEAVETIDSDFAFSDSEPVTEAKQSRDGGPTPARTSVIVDAGHQTKMDSDCKVVVDVDEADCTVVSENKTRTQAAPVRANGTLQGESKVRKPLVSAMERTGGGGEERLKDDGTGHEKSATLDPKVQQGDESRQADANPLASATKPDCHDNGNNAEEEEPSGPAAKIMLRLPDGQRKQLSLSAAASLDALIKRVAKEGFSEEKYELITNYPRRRLSALNPNTTLADAGLCPQESIFVQER